MNLGVNDWSDLWRQLSGHEAGPFVQFIKYAVGGGVATLSDMLVFYTLSWKVFPALTSADPVARRLGWTVRPVDDTTRSRRFILNSALAFLISNFTAYLINIWWVFQPGRYAWYVELGLFYAVSLVAIALGTALGWAMIRGLRLSTSASYLGKMLSALLINFVCRKFVIFKG